MARGWASSNVDDWVIRDGTGFDSSHERERLSLQWSVQLLYHPLVVHAKWYRVSLYTYESGAAFTDFQKCDYVNDDNNRVFAMAPWYLWRL